GVETEYYDPLIGADIRHLLRPTTQLIWCESPGSVTMEVQDIGAISKAARQAGVVTALDNTYAAGVLFDAFSAGVDVAMQALTKYIGGHSDVLLGSVTTRDHGHYQALGDARRCHRTSARRAQALQDRIQLGRSDQPGNAALQSAAAPPEPRSIDRAFQYRS